MRSLLKVAAIGARVVLRVTASVLVIGALVAPFMPNGYFALLPILAGVTLWLLSDIDWMTPRSALNPRSRRGRGRARS